MERIAFIDLGSNSVRFIITEIADNGSYQMVYQEKETIRLSEGMWEHNALTESAMERALLAMKGFAHMAEVMAVTYVYAVATAAVRLAHNGEDFIQRVKDETGFELHCIDGQEEARLGFLGIINTMDLENFISFDLGGASTEVALVENRNIVKSVSLPVGAVTLNGIYPTPEAVNQTVLRQMMDYVEDILEKYDWLKNRKLPLVGIGGTARNLAKMDQRREHYPIDKIHNYKIHKDRLKTLFAMVRDKSMSQRRKISGLSSERADIIVAGTVIVEALMHWTHSKTLIVGGSGLREGLFYYYYSRHYLNGSGIIEHILMHSTENVLLSLPQNDLVHARYVKKLAHTLFDQLRPLLDCQERCGDLLDVAALLHDIGKRINYYSHARHGAYMLVNSNLYGISHKEQAMCALMVMNSHGISNKNYRHFEYGDLLDKDDWARVQRLSLLLAIAEGLDESHEQFVTSVEVHITSKQVRIEVLTLPNCNTATADTIMRKLGKSFKKEFKRDLVVIWHVDLYGSR